MNASGGNVNTIQLISSAWLKWLKERGWRAEMAERKLTYQLNIS